MLPGDITVLDWIALALFLAAWLGYGALMGLVFGRRATINRLMGPLRRAWMGAMLRRDNRITDAALIGHIMQSNTFFASTAILVVAGILGVLGSVEAAYGVISDLEFVRQTSRGLFELKMLLLLVMFVYGFFQFTWSLRQLNYTVALIGSAPPAAELEGPALAAVAANAAAVLDMAVASFNAGLRAYYFALAAVGWFVQPWLFIAATLGVAAILVRRQAFSAARRAIEAQVQLLGPK